MKKKYITPKSEVFAVINNSILDGSPEIIIDNNPGSITPNYSKDEISDLSYFE